MAPTWVLSLRGTRATDPDTQPQRLTSYVDPQGAIPKANVVCDDGHPGHCLATLSINCPLCCVENAWPLCWMPGQSQALEATLNTQKRPPYIFLYGD